MPHNYASTEDLDLAVKHIQKQFPKARLYALGISMGANRLIKYAATKGDKCPILGITCVANPWDVLLCSRELEHFSKFIYSRQIANKLKEKIIISQEQHRKNPALDVGTIRLALSLPIRSIGSVLEDARAKKTEGFHSDMLF